MSPQVGPLVDPGWPGTARALAGFGLALWLGGGVMAVLSTSAVFGHAGGQPLAGEIAATILRRLSAVTLVAIALLGGSWLFGVRGVAAAAWAAGAVLFGISELGVRPAIRKLRADMGGSTENVPAGDPRRKRFGALHGVSMALLLAQLACAGAALVALSLRS